MCLLTTSVDYSGEIEVPLRCGDLLVNSRDGLKISRCYNNDLDVSSPLGVTNGIHRTINEADARIVGYTCGGDDDADFRGIHRYFRVDFVQPCNSARPDLAHEA